MTEYNNYPEHARPRQLKKGETVEFELVNLPKNPLDKEGSLAIPFVRGIPPEDTIFVPGKKGEDGVYVNIGYITGFERDGRPVFGAIHFYKTSAGVVRCTGGRSDDQKKFEFLSMCSWNGDSPYRNEREPVIFREINYKRKAQDKREKRKAMKDALNRAENLTLPELRRICIGLGYNVNNMDADEMRDKAESYAESNPIDFMVKIENNDFGIMEVANTAKSKKLIDVNLQKRQITSVSGEIIHSWAPSKTAKWDEEFVKFVKTDEGSKFFRELKETLKV